MLCSGVNGPPSLFLKFAVRKRSEELRVGGQVSKQCIEFGFARVRLSNSHHQIVHSFVTVVDHDSVQIEKHSD